MGLIAATQSALFQHHIDMLFYHLFMTSSSRVYSIKRFSWAVIHIIFPIFGHNLTFIFTP